jgi:hypothetical protein
MSRSSKLQVVGAVVETTQGSAASFGTGSYLMVEDAEINPVPEILERGYKTASLSSLASIIGKLYVEVKLKVALKGTTAAGTANAPQDALLQACSFISTDNGTTSTVYSLASATISNFAGMGKSCTIQFYEAGPAPIYHLVVGCVAKSAKITLKAGGMVMLDATYQGIYAAPTDASFPSVVYTETVKEPIFQSSTLSVNSVTSLVVANIEIDLGLETVLRENSLSAYGVGGFAVLGRKVTGSIDPEVVALSVHDPFALSLARTEFPITFKADGAAAGNKFAFSLPKCQYNDVAYGERGAVKVYKCPFQANQTTADDELVITVT